MSDPIIDPTDLGTYLGIDITPALVPRVAYIIELAQSMCEAQPKCNPLPNGAAPVVVDVVTRAFLNAGNVTQENTGPFGVNWGAVAGGLWLTNQNKANLRLAAGIGGAFMVDTLSPTFSPVLPWWGANNVSPSVTGDWDTFS